MEDEELKQLEDGNELIEDENSNSLDGQSIEEEKIEDTGVTEDDGDTFSQVQEEDAPSKEDILLNILQEMKNNLDTAMSLLGEYDNRARGVSIHSGDNKTSKVLEGVFAGDGMIGADGERYDIPPNYASKSKLIEGDIMKLTITSNGNFVYKQIGPMPRKRLMGELAVDEEKDEYWVVVDNNKWRILKASVTYFKGYSGDKVAFMVPQDGPSKWAAVEHIVKNDGISEESL